MFISRFALLVTALYLSLYRYSLFSSLKPRSTNAKHGHEHEHDSVVAKILELYLYDYVADLHGFIIKDALYAYVTNFMTFTTTISPPSLPTPRD